MHSWIHSLSNRPQLDPDRDLLAEIARLEPLAKSEQLAGGRENPWKGSTEALKDARARLEAARLGREAEAQAETVRRYQNELVWRDEVRSKVTEIDAKLSAFSETTREYFKKANRRALWIGRQAGMGTWPVHGGQQRDYHGRVIDVSPLDAYTGKVIVPPEEWEAVKQYRDLYIERSAVAMPLDSIERSLRDMVAKNPALAMVKAPRLAVSV